MRHDITAVYALPIGTLLMLLLAFRRVLNEFDEVLQPAPNRLVNSCLMNLEGSSDRRDAAILFSVPNLSEHFLKRV